MKNLVFFIVAVLFLFSCEEKTTRIERKEKPKEEIVYKKAPSFNQDSAYLYVKSQVDFGPRVPNSEEHKVCGDWLVSELEKYGAVVYQQEFKKKAYDKNVLELRNIIGEFNPNAQKRILLAAHWDTRHIADRDTENQDQPIDGANDGASGVGVLLEIARVISTSDLKIGVDVIFFDGEDYGQPEGSEFAYMEDSWCFGAQHWSRNKHRNGYRADFGILLDMVGAPGARFAKEGVSRYFAPAYVDKIWSTANRIGYQAIFWNHNSDEITDDHLYVNQLAKIPMVDIIEYDPNAKAGYFGHYHHTHKDNMDVIDKATLKAVGQTVLEVIWNE